MNNQRRNWLRLCLAVAAGSLGTAVLPACAAAQGSRSTWLEWVSPQIGHWAEWVDFAHVAKVPVLLGFNAADYGREIERKTDTAIVQEEMLGSAVPDPIDAQITRWAQDEFSLGSYSYNALGMAENARETLAHPLGQRL